MNQLTNIFKLLSDDTRLRMILLLYQQDLCVCEISGILNAPQPRISKNLSKLRDLNLVLDERREKFVFYTLKKDNLLLTQTLKQILDEIELYPQILRDSENLVDKEQFLNQSCLICE
ncbi:metalloregulator ArsR/SmtB family transcription factor [Fusibacter sp. 3D3]|uniref:ArsR/SmtB family transcription factor n=1 Tax=Fusibacter sp. 3D3 TaxID=1048380 RepID=UPI000852C58B|nr:metalloregulator ArsR/SmtB family transcription factor [Fusibacter sp. 3D3]GAU76519.1 arsenical resistance operon repressor [Fusibacter sp. 3D3]